MQTTIHLRLINFAHFVVHYMLLIFPTAVLAIEHEWQKPYGEILKLGTAGLVAFALATLPAGWLGDRLSRPWLMATFLVGGGGACLAGALVDGPISLVIVISAIGMFAALYHPVGLAMLGDLSARQGHTLAVNGVFGNLGLAGAALGTGLLSDTLGWRAAFWVPGAVILAAGVAYAVYLLSVPLSARSQVAATSTSNSYSRRQQLRVVLLVAASALFGGLIFNGVTATLPKVLDERLLGDGLSISIVGGASAMVFAIAAFAQLPVGNALDRYGARPVLLLLLSVQALALLGLTNAHGLVALGLAIVLVIGVFAEIPVTSWLLARVVSPRLRARAYSLEYVFSLGVSSLVIPVIATLHEGYGGFRVMFPMLAAAAGVVLCCALFLPPMPSQKQMQSEE